MLHIAAVFECATSPRMIDQDVPHHLRAHREEMRSILPIRDFTTSESQICFVNQGRRLQGVAILFTPRVPVCDAAQFVVNQGSQLFERRRVAVLPIVQQDC